MDQFMKDNFSREKSKATESIVGKIFQYSEETGKIIKDHPLFRKSFSYEKFLSFIRQLRLESKLQFLRRELAIKNSPLRLIKINKYYRTISGGFAQINEPVHRPYVEQVFSMPFEESMSDPTLNLRFAFLLYSELEAEGRCGWQPWSMC